MVTMNLSLRHAIYSAILSTEATATFMFLPSWNGSMITNPYSSLLTAYPHLCYKLGRIPTNEIANASPQSWISQGTLLPLASWNLHIIAGCKILLVTSLKQGSSTTLLAIPSVMLGMLRQRLVSRFEKLYSDKMQTIICSHRPTLGDVAPLSHHSKPGLTLKIPDWKSWTYTDGSCHIQGGKTVIGAGVYHPSLGNSNLVEPNGAGITNIIGRADLAATAAAITHDHIHIAADSHTSLHQIRKQLFYPEKHRHRVQGDILKVLSNYPKLPIPHLPLQSKVSCWYCQK